MRLAKVQKESYDEKEVLLHLKEIEENIDFKVIHKIYYPYFHFEFNVLTKGLMKKKITSGCVIDGVNGRGALIDCEPGFNQTPIEADQTIMEELTYGNAGEEAKQFMYRSTSIKLKSMSVPVLALKKKTFFYRPFYVVDDGDECSNHLLTIDSITGNFHPI
ncbi:hypothetical protein [Halobacillus karajensis]|uniref:Uncharacterized protein n=1 Tax=Halobacillus karajensis TaxID=195088 RepID=A0A059NWK6_9BACI|nr:hypothetical protein [Halobacillus karajensis]CDQ19017.1 hypothetical protein BN982_01299 [Halobacillus karajensis]CDQ22909.1 hypothetical protein BN983_01127 [Halobacillus karajensis]CDQ26391.1 hypothetical protein BN981_00607 [Halobacillus karajensis]